MATVGDKFSQHALTAAGGSGKSYAFTLSGQPSWLTVTSAGLLSGTPPATANSSVNFTITATDNLKGSVSISYTLNIDPALVLSPSTLNTVTVGNAFSTQLTAAGGSGEDYVFTSSALPAGVKLDSDGTLHGTPTTATGSPLHFHRHSHRQYGRHSQRSLNYDSETSSGGYSRYAADGQRMRQFQPAIDGDGRLGSGLYLLAFWSARLVDDKLHRSAERHAGLPRRDLRSTSRSRLPIATMPQATPVIPWPSIRP